MCYHLLASWMSDVKVTGSPPPPCWDCSFVKVSEDDPIVAVFGGECPNDESSTQRFRWISDIYMLNLNTKVY